MLCALYKYVYIIYRYRYMVGEREKERNGLMHFDRPIVFSFPADLFYVLLGISFDEKCREC